MQAASKNCLGGEQVRDESLLFEIIENDTHETYQNNYDGGREEKENEEDFIDTTSSPTSVKLLMRTPKPINRRQTMPSPAVFASTSKSARFASPSSIEAPPSYCAAARTPPRGILRQPQLATQSPPSPTLRQQQRQKSQIQQKLENNPQRQHCLPHQQQSLQKPSTHGLQSARLQQLPLKQGITSTRSPYVSKPTPGRVTSTPQRLGARPRVSLLFFSQLISQDNPLLSSSEKIQWRFHNHHG